MIYVIGSGPAAAACVSALVNRGVKVTVLDAGIQLEKKFFNHLADYRERGDPRSLEALKGGMIADPKGIPLKLSFGSDFPYQEASEALGITNNSSGLLPSFAFGGLSNVWGAAMLPYRDDDIYDWPIKSAELAPHYHEVAKITHLTSLSNGTMDEVFPSYCTNSGILNLNTQGTSLWNDLHKARKHLRENGILFGRGRVAVKTSNSTSSGCDYKGLCMYGCPDGYIYNSRDTIMDFQKQGRIDYLPDIVVQKISESNQGVEILCVHRGSGVTRTFKGTKAFLGAGVIPSARILMESMALREKKLVMRDSQYFLFPLLRMMGASGISKEPSNNLSQIFLELIKSSGLERSSHLQIYGYNEIIEQALKSTLGLTGKAIPGLVRFLEERIMIVQGYLHSDLSGTIEAWLERGEGGVNMRIEALGNHESRKHITQIMRKLLVQTHRLKAVPIVPMLQIPAPGRGFHTGSSFPMRHNPKDLESDIWGRPLGFKNMHVVDSSVLPSIPATTITFSVMANAHRIATTCEL